MSNLVVNRKNMFLETPDFDVKKNYFDLSFLHARDMEIGKLYPIGLIRTMPGDKVKASLNIKGYMESLLKNGFYNFRLNIRAYYSRFSDLDPLAEGVLTGGPDGDYDGVFPTFYLAAKEHFKKPYDSLQDCFGLPITNLDGIPLASNRKVNALPFIMYDLIYHNHYIDSIIEDNISNYIINTPLRKKKDTIEKLTDNNTRFYNSNGSYLRMFQDINSFKSYLSSHGYPEVIDGSYSDNDILNFIYNVNYVKDRYTSAKLSEQLGTPPRLPIDMSSAFDFNSSPVNKPLTMARYFSPSINPTKTDAVNVPNGSKNVSILNTSASDNNFIGGIPNLSSSLL